MHHGHGRDDDGGIDLDNLGLGRSLNGFINLVDAILVIPANDVFAAGRDGATDAASKLFWVRGPGGTLLVRAAPGYLTTRTGDGGFSLVVQRDGSWSLSLD